MTSNERISASTVAFGPQSEALLAFLTNAFATRVSRERCFPLHELSRFQDLDK